MAGLVTEQQLHAPTLRLAASRPGGFISTSDLIAELSEEFEPEGMDARTLGGRNDSYFSQKVRNIVSHRDSGTSFIKKGYAEYVPARRHSDRGIRITDQGRRHLAALGEGHA